MKNLKLGFMLVRILLSTRTWILCGRLEDLPMEQAFYPYTTLLLWKAFD